MGVSGINNLPPLRDIFSTALSVKMSAMLYAPGILVILFKRHGLLGTVRHLCILFITQLVFAQSFLLESTPAYLSRAFDLSRVFLYKWTVNWRFLSEDTFLRRDLAMGLLACHALVLVAFGIVKWCRADGGVASVLRRGLQRPAKSPALVPVTADGEHPGHFLEHRVLTASVCRCDDNLVHVQPDWHPLCSVFALSILFVVCTTASVPRLAHEVSRASEVSLHSCIW